MSEGDRRLRFEDGFRKLMAPAIADGVITPAMVEEMIVHMRLTPLDQLVAEVLEIARALAIEADAEEKVERLARIEVRVRRMQKKH
jgi:hypothetical protein